MVQKIEKVENPQVFYEVWEYGTYPRQKNQAWTTDGRMFDTVEQAENWIKAECAINHKYRSSAFQIREVRIIEFLRE